MKSSWNWKKLGRLYTPESTHPKLLSHASNPLPILLKDNIYRVFFSSRDSENRSSVGAVDIDIISQKVLKVHDKPIFEHGPPGSFYAEGISIGNCYEVLGQRYILFMGWQNNGKDDWRGDIGRLVLTEDLTLLLDGQTPFMNCDNTDLLSLSYPWVIPNKTNGYHMWYGSTQTWNAGNNEMLHVINYATSNNGTHWNRHGLAVPYEMGKAQACSRPTVLQDKTGDFHMWFSYRGGPETKYKIGYAWSQDALTWHLGLEQSGIGLSLTGWDSEMIEYPYVFEHRDNYYMLYNGNEYGKTGFGLATAKLS